MDTRPFKTASLLVIVSLPLISKTFAVDTFDPATGYISIPSVIAGNEKYFNIVVSLKELISGGDKKADRASTISSIRPDTYDLNTQQLLIPAIEVGETVYKHLVVTIDQVISGPTHYEEVADPGFNGELLATDYNLFISTDLPDSVEQELRYVMDVAIKHWGRFGNLDWYVMGTDEAATRELENEICSHWISSHKITRDPLFSSNTFRCDENWFINTRPEYYRQIAADALSQGSQGGSMGVNYQAWYGFIPMSFSTPWGFLPREFVNHAFMDQKLPTLPANFGSELFGDSETPGGIFHEYWHVIQHSHISNTPDKLPCIGQECRTSEYHRGPRDDKLGPMWFTEGGAEYMTFLAVSELQAAGELRLYDGVAFDTANKMYWFMLNSLEKWNSYPNIKMKDIISEGHPLYEDRINYEIGAWCYAYLINRVGDPDVVLEVFHPNVDELGWEGAFYKAFGLTPEEFYEEFDLFLTLPYSEQKLVLEESISNTCRQSHCE